MKNLLIAIPEGETTATMTEQELEIIAQYKSQWVAPMPGTRTFNGRYIADCIMTDDFDAALLTQLGKDWIVLYDSASTPLDTAAFIDYLADEVTTDEEGNVVSTKRPTEYKETHRWGGWPSKAA